MKSTYEINLGNVIPELGEIKISGSIEMTAVEAVAMIGETKKFIAELPDLIGPAVIKLRGYFEDFNRMYNEPIEIEDEENHCISFDSNEEAIEFLLNAQNIAIDEINRLEAVLEGANRHIDDLKHRLDNEYAKTRGKRK